MTIVPELQLLQFMKRQAANLSGVLIHGTDTSAVSMLVREATAKWGSGKSSAIVRMDAASLRSDPSRLGDEYRSMSLLGDRLAIVVSGCDDGLLRSLSTVLSIGPTENFIVLEAESLGKTSKLRLACEQASNFACVAVYEEDSAALQNRIRKRLEGDGFQWSGDAEQVFFGLVGEGRTAAIHEIEKLSLYCHGLSVITEQDVKASCGDTASFAPDDLVDAVLDGDFDLVDRMFSSLDRDASQPSAILQQLMYHLQRLQSMRLDMSNGANPESAMARARPPVFFKRKSAVVSQLKRLDLLALEELVLSVADAVADARSQGALAESIVGRALFWIANYNRTKMNGRV
jgi:DNA polymerase III subunit delta